ncbi:MAG: hypothetical protein AAGF31_07555, partial [Planctomycetota bacterium]
IAADRTQPGGTFYFARNRDVRSQARHTCYKGVAETLRAEGARAKIVQGTVPVNAVDIMGFSVGARFSDLAAARSAVLPGAICEHFTSFGGDLREDRSQMPLTEFLRQGAAGASGTVTEPRAIQAKFPLPSVHVHYRRGCSLAEAFYQSVASPYQLLIVGDPLCQPWASPPPLQVDGIQQNQTVSGVLEFTATANPPTLVESEPIDLFIDGRLVARFPSGKTVKFNTAGITDGYHELRFVATSSDAIESRSRVVLSIVVDNDPTAGLELSLSPLPVAEFDEFVVLTATAPNGESPEPVGAASVGTEPTDGEPGEIGQANQAAGEASPEASPSGKTVIFEHSGQELGRATLQGSDVATASLRVPANKLGSGPLRLRARLESGIQAVPQWMVVR